MRTIVLAFGVGVALTSSSRSAGTALIGRCPRSLPRGMSDRDGALCALRRSARRRVFAYAPSRRAELASDLRPLTPKHPAKGEVSREQQARRVNNIANPEKSAKPPSPVQIRAAPPIPKFLSSKHR